MFNYSAPNPYPPTLWSTITYWFPSISASESCSGSIGKLILPAQSRTAMTVSQAKINQYSALTIETGLVNTFDGAEISTLEFKPNRPSDLYIIKCNGNGTLCEDMIDYFAYDANSLNVNVIGFNYRGVGNSTGKAAVFQNLVTDGIAQVQRLLEKGVPAQNILIDGHSLGGAVATEVAAYFHAKKQRVYLWNSSSFSSLSKAAAGIFNGNIVNNVLPTYLETSSSYSLQSAMLPMGWEVKPAQSYLTIPPTHRGYMVVSKQCGDGVISHPASLHMGVKASEKRAGIMTGHRVNTPGRNIGHNTDRHRLFNTKNPSQSAQQVFEEYVKTHLGNS